MRARTCRGRIAAAVVGVGLGVAAVSPPALAADRAIELVTPAGSRADVRLPGGESTPDGEIVCYNSETAIAGAQSNGVPGPQNGFCSRRTASGWETEWVTGPPVLPEPNSGRGSQVYHVSPDGRRVVFASDQGIFPDFRGVVGGSVYGTLSAFMYEGGRTRWLAPTPEPLRDGAPTGTPGLSAERAPAAVSADLRYGVFWSRLRLLPEDRNDELDVYQWTPDDIRLVSRDAGGDAVGGLIPFGTESDQVQAQPGTISRDGSRIFFHHRGALAGSPADRQSVFMRRGEELVHVSPRRGPGPAADVAFAGASADGEHVYLLTAEQLTAEAKQPGNALYRYDVGGDRLELVASQLGGIFFLGISEDGSTLVYRSGTGSLFVNRHGREINLGTINIAQDVVHALGGWVASTKSDRRALRISADGSTIVFASAASFDGAPTANPITDRVKVYRWTEETGVRWISANADRSEPTSNATIGNYGALLPTDPRAAIMNAMRYRPNLGRVMSADGRRVFFETRDRLVAGDVNDALDVYEWRDGEISLVTPGTQPDDAFYHDSSADGRTVFFMTLSRLIPELDKNTTVDMYAAREGGGFPLPPRPRPCQGEECQGDLPRAPAHQRPGSAAFEGLGNEQAVPPVVPRHVVAKLTPRQRRMLARRGRTVVRVRANEKGIVTVLVTARIGRRGVRVASATRAVRPRATVRVPIRLSQRARAALRERKRLRVTIRVAYSESDVTRRQAVMLRG